MATKQNGELDRLRPASAWPHDAPHMTPFHWTCPGVGPPCAGCPVFYAIIGAEVEVGSGSSKGASMSKWGRYLGRCSMLVHWQHGRGC